MRVVRRSLLVVAVVAAFVGVVPARAAVPTTWSDPVNLDAPNEVGRPVAVGMDAAGNALAIWLADTGAAPKVIRSATRAPGGEWSAPIDRSDRVEIDDPIAFAEDQTGRAVLAWSQYNGAHFTIHAMTIHADGTWDPVVEVSAPDTSAGDAHATIDEQGHAVLAWDGEGGIQTATYSFGGGWSAIDTLDSTNEAAAVQVSSNAAGDVSATWWLQYVHQVFAATRPAGGSWTAAVMLSGSGIETSVSGVAQGPGASARAVWTELHGSQWTVVSADRSAIGTWSAAIDIGPTNTTSPVTIRTNQSGNSVLLLSSAGSVGLALVASSRSPSGPWQPLVPVSPDDRSVSFSTLAMNPNGDAVLAMDLEPPGVPTETWTRSLPVGGLWSDPVRVDRDAVYTSGSQVALNDAGDAVIAWIREGDFPAKVQAVTSPAPIAPPTPIVRIPSFTG